MIATNKHSMLFYRIRITPSKLDGPVELFYAKRSKKEFWCSIINEDKTGWYNMKKAGSACISLYNAKYNAPIGVCFLRLKEIKKRK